jgi:4'-phosphopantetheinyl transferase
MPLRFNLSHTPGLVACAVTLTRDIGLDVEASDRNLPDIDSIIAHFAEIERQYLSIIDPVQRQKTFYKFWTLKEAYLKAIGKGLALPLNTFGFILDGYNIRFTTATGEQPAHWQFRLFRPTEQHQLAVAVRQASSVALAWSYVRVNSQTLNPPDRPPTGRS